MHEESFTEGDRGMKNKIKKFLLSVLPWVILIGIVAVMLIIEYLIASSDLPFWFKWFLLK